MADVDADAMLGAAPDDAPRRTSPSDAFQRTWRAPTEGLWGAGSLEWAVAVPSPNYNFAAPPVVDRRYPLWDMGDELATAIRVRDESELDYIEELRDLPDHHRATLVTSVVEGEPQGLWNLAGPSYIPVITAAFVTLVAVAPIIGAYWLMGVGAVGAIILLVRWLWPSPMERERLLHEPLNERLGLPLEGRGSQEAGWWGVVLFLVAVASAYGISLFAYFYLKLYSPEWPQGGIAPPVLLLPAVAAALLLAGIGSSSAGARAIRRDDQRGLRTWLLVSAVLGVGFLVVQVMQLLGAGVPPQLNAYASIQSFLAGLGAFTALLAVALVVGVLLRALRGHLNERFNASVQHTALVFNVVAALNLVTLAVIHLTPHLG